MAITPNPFNHAVFANKDNLCLLSNEQMLNDLEVDQVTKEILLTHIPKTVKVSANNEALLWSDRRNYFLSLAKDLEVVPCTGVTN